MAARNTGSCWKDTSSSEGKGERRRRRRRRQAREETCPSGHGIGFVQEGLTEAGLSLEMVGISLHNSLEPRDGLVKIVCRGGGELIEAIGSVEEHIDRHLLLSSRHCDSLIIDRYGLEDLCAVKKMVAIVTQADIPETISFCDSGLSSGDNSLIVWLVN
jgi:hypothetical protein